MGWLDTTQSIQYQPQLGRLDLDIVGCPTYRREMISTVHLGSILTLLLIAVTGLVFAQPAAADAGAGDAISAPYLCAGGANSISAPRYESTGPRAFATVYDTVCVPDQAVCASHLSTVGPPSFLAGTPGFPEVMGIVCVSEALGYRANGENYIRFVIERQFNLEGSLENSRYVTETVSHKFSNTIYTCDDQKFATNVGELAFTSSFTATGADALRLYRAFFNRRPDLEGAKFWTNQNNHHMGLESISAFFATSSEFRIRYGTVSNAEFLDILYANVLGRDYDQEGYDFWLSELVSERRDRANVVAWFARSPELRMTEPYPNPTDPEQFDLWLDADDERTISCLYLANKPDF